MTPKDQKSINNLYHRYANYDSDGTKYAYDIYFTTIESPDGAMKSKRQKGVDNFRRHIRELMEDYDDVTTITVTDYTGTNAKAAMLNRPVVIELMDVKTIERTPRVIVRNNGQPAPPERQPDILPGLSGLFAGTEFEGLGNLAPVAKFIDDKHTIDRLREKNGEHERRIAELEKQAAEQTGKYDTLHDAHEQLQDEADDMSDELEYYRGQDKKQDKWMDMIGLAGASVAKNFLKQNPGILSGIIPAEQLAGFFADEPAQEPATAPLTDEGQSQLDDATIVFDWLQTLDKTAFERVISIIAVIRQNPDYAGLIIQFLNGNKQISKTSNDDNR